MAKFNECFNPKVKCLISHCMPYEEWDEILFNYFCWARNLHYIIRDLDSLQRQTSMPLKWGSLNSRHLLAGLTPSRSFTIPSLLHSVQKVLMFPQLLLKNTSTDCQRSAKDRVSETYSMLMSMASSTHSFSASPLHSLKTHTRLARDKSSRTASLSYLPALQWERSWSWL